MSLLLIALGAMAIATPLMLVYAVFVQYPRLKEARFRAELWEMRDALFDSAIEGRFSSPDPAFRLVALIEVMAQSTRQISASFTLLSQGLTRDLSVADPLNQILNDPKLTPSDSAELELVFQALLRRMSAHISRPGSDLPSWSVLLGLRLRQRFRALSGRGVSTPSTAAMLEAATLGEMRFKAVHDGATLI